MSKDERYDNETTRISRVRKIQDRRRSGASGTHLDGRTNRMRDRASIKRYEIAESS
jgi:hypothetical protein